MKKITFVIASLILVLSVQSQQFKINYTKSVFDNPFTGKVFLYISKNNRNPKNGAVGIEFFPCFSVDVKNVMPGTSILINDKAVSFPVKISEVERGEYFVQAVWDRNLGGRAIAESAGNMYSKPGKATFTKDITKSFTIVCDQVIPTPFFKETEFVKELKTSSSLLSSFHKKPITIDAAIILPKEYYTESQRRFPVLFNVSGYGGDYHFYSGDSVTRSRPFDSIACITVYLDGNCSLGHSVYANSDNNGPWGDALVKEFIPQLESKYRCDGARLLKGHSSGGWTVLWLQTQYPSTFTACWSSSPDPVDFRDFQKIDLYAGDNLFYDKDSLLRSVATVAGFFPWASSKQAYQSEHVIYRGEQMHSFDAVFGPKGKDGNPVSICDPQNGELNKEAFHHWKKYDISLNLRTNWNSLKNDLEGKIRISVGEQDNFLLQSAVHKMEEEMKKINAGIVFAYYPGDHFTVSTPQYRNDANKFLAEKYRSWQISNKKGF